MGDMGPSAVNMTFEDRIDPAHLRAACEKSREEGWAVIPDVLTPEETALVLERLWDGARADRDKGLSSHAPIDPNENNVRVRDLILHDQVFTQLVEHPAAVKLVQSVIGKDYIISNFAANIARPGSASMGLHSDQSLIMPDPWLEEWAVNIIWALTDVYYENGATLFVPGSNKWARQDEIPKDVKARLRPFEAKAGSIIVMTGKVWHTSGCNTTKDQDRALLLAFYTVPFLRQQINWTARLSDERKEQISNTSPGLFEKLGLNPRANMTRVGALRFLEDQFNDEK